MSNTPTPAEQAERIENLQASLNSHREALRSLTKAALDAALVLRQITAGLEGQDGRLTEGYVEEIEAARSKLLYVEFRD